MVKIQNDPSIVTFYAYPNTSYHKSLHLQLYMKIPMPRTHFALFILALLPFNASSQCPTIILSDTLLVSPPSGSILTPVLAGGGTVLSTTWAPAIGLSNASVLNPTATPSISTLYHLTVKAVDGVNLVVNGNFSNGSTGFSSSYTDYTSSGTNQLPANGYAIGTDPLLVNIYAGMSYGDHTSGTGNMMIINGASTPTNVWCQTITVTPNTDYDFSAWLSNWSATTNGLPVLQFQINGILLGSPYVFGPTVGVWSQFSSTWNSGSSTSATICINDQQTAAIGNDFALDDISFRKYCTATDSVFVKLSQDTIINKYAAVLNFNPCLNSLTVDNASEFSIGDTVLMIQMKGAVVDSSNSATFGNVLDYKNAGNYEYNVISGVSGNIISLQYILQRPYTIPAGKVQIVSVPRFFNYTTTAPHTCLPWDGSKGGVFAITVDNILELNAPIDVTGKGFRGGQPSLLAQVTCNKTDYFYPPGANDGGAKGEGITVVSPGKLYGRGHLANAGGGGNAHNSGGGGGSNAGIAGQGGNQHPYAPCQPIIPQIGGIGGQALSTSVAANKLFLGGGGGCGHGNDFQEKAGGNGGGLIIIKTGNLLGGNNLLAANGDDGDECTSAGPNCANDGTGGGGGGGSIVLATTSTSGMATLAANGGKGANAYLTSPGTVPQVGPGGGGSGGLIWFTSASTPIGISTTLSGGINGILPQFGNDPFGAQPGNAGQILGNFPYNFATVLPTNTISAAFQDSSLSCLNHAFYVTNATPGASYSWNFGVAGSSTQPNPTVTFPAAGTYPVTLIASNNSGCSDTLTKNIIIGPCKKIINAYAAVTGTGPCNGMLVDETTGFQVGDTVLMIQMKGAIIDTSNSTAFGDILNYKSAGNYEYKRGKSHLRQYHLTGLQYSTYLRNTCWQGATGYRASISKLYRYRYHYFITLEWQQGRNRGNGCGQHPNTEWQN